MGHTTDLQIDEGTRSSFVCELTHFPHSNYTGGSVPDFWWCHFVAKFAII